MIELIDSELDRRAEQSSFGIIGDIEKVLLESANNNPPTCVPASVFALWCRHQHVGNDHPVPYAAKIFEGSANYSQIQVCLQLV